MNKIRVFTAFSGYDSQCIALDRIKRDYPDLFDYELIGWSEIDRCAINAHYKNNWFRFRNIRYRQILLHNDIFVSVSRYFNRWF